MIIDNLFWLFLAAAILLSILKKGALIYIPMILGLLTLLTKAVFVEPDTSFAALCVAGLAFVSFLAYRDIKKSKKTKS